MRCKNCKQKIENENLYRCPHCGKQLVKKKKKDPKESAELISFLAVSGIYVVLNLFSLSFSCKYYSTAALIIGIVVFLIAVPFILGNFSKLSRSIGDIMAIAVALPFIANWCAVFVPDSYTLAVNAYTSAYYFSVIGVLIITVVILILKALGTIKNGGAAKWICLGMGIAEMIFSIAFYAPSAKIKAFAIMIIAINSLFPCYVAYHIISKDGKSNLT